MARIQYHCLWFHHLMPSLCPQEYIRQLCSNLKMLHNYIIFSFDHFKIYISNLTVDDVLHSTHMHAHAAGSPHACMTWVVFRNYSHLEAVEKYSHIYIYSPSASPIKHTVKHLANYIIFIALLKRLMLKVYIKSSGLQMVLKMHVVRRMVCTGHFFGREPTLQNTGIKRTKIN